MDDESLEKELLALLAHKDPTALERLYAAYRRKLLLTAWHVLGWDDAEAEDAVQETFIHASKTLAEVEIHTSLYGWLNRVCVLRCIDIIRARKKMLAKQDVTLEAMTQPQARERVRRQEQDDEEAAQVDQLHRAVASLDEPCQTLVRDRDILGLSYIDIAKKHQIALGTVMSRLSRCRETLKQKLIRLQRKER